MPRLRSNSSRPYPGRPDRQATLWDSVDASNGSDDRSGVSRGHSTCSHTGKGRTQCGSEGPASSLDTAKPNGRVSQRRVAVQPHPEFFLLERILSRENMLAAWKQVKANKGKPGVDDMTIEDCWPYLQAHWDDIRAALLAGTYDPLPVRRAEIPKPTGGTRPFEDIDSWIRRRIRMCFWKQWRYARTKVRELVKLGTRLKTAIDVAISRKGPWRLSRTPATQTGMTNRWLAQLGLFNVKELWCKIHYPASPWTAR